jgi:hypothetical protein
MCCRCCNVQILRILVVLLFIAGIGFVVYNMLDEEHKRVVKYLLKYAKYLPDRYML